MRGFFIICAGLLFVGVINLPIGYYTFLRIVVTVGSTIAIVNEFKNGLTLWVISFGLIGILFNPFIPIYLNDKSAWMPIDIIVGIFFAIKSFTLKTK